MLFRQLNRCSVLLEDPFVEDPSVDPLYRTVVLCRFQALPDTHTCANTSCCTFTLASYVHCRVFATILCRFQALPDTHTCANTSCCTFTLASYVHCRVWAYPLFYIIVFLSKYRTKLSKPPEYPLDIPRIPRIPMTWPPL
jgi:hypothetical protein